MEPPNLDVARQLFRTSKKVALTREAYGWKSNRETVTCLIRKRKSYSMFLSPSYDFMRHYSAILGKRRGQKNKESDEQSKEERDVTEPLRRWDYWCEIGQRFPELLIPSLPHDSPYPTSASVHSRPDPPPPPALSAHLSLNSFLLSLTWESDTPPISALHQLDSELWMSLIHPQVWIFAWAMVSFTCLLNRVLLSRFFYFC